MDALATQALEPCACGDGRFNGFESRLEPFSCVRGHEYLGDPRAWGERCHDLGMNAVDMIMLRARMLW